MNTRSRTTRGFTIIELLVVIVIILVLIGIALPVFVQVRRGASTTAAESQLQSLATGIEQFKSDHGFIPPLILDDPDVEPTDPDWCTSITARDDAREKLEEERYHSIYSLPVYLLGVGGLSPDEMATNPERHDGFAGAGFRDPGPDNAWGGARQRTTTTHRVAASGQVFGPYIDFADSDLVRAASSDDLDFPEDGSVGQNTPGSPWRLMSVITDPWGTPIRYYRNWPTRDAADRSVRVLTDAPTELVSVDALRAVPEGEMVLDASLDDTLVKSEYALLSAGPDETFTPIGFAEQSAPPSGLVSDFLGLDIRERSLMIRESLADNIRLTR